MLGQVSIFLALKAGDVSVATPVMGVKTILVAGLATFLFAERPPWQLWAAAVLSAAAIAALNRTGPGASHGSRRRVLATSLWAFASAACYSLFDVLMQRWAPAWGAGRFLPLMAFVAAVPSVAAWTAFGEPRTEGRAAWPWLLGGAAVMAAQAVILTGGLAVYGDATAVNVVYSSRGLWAVRRSSGWSAAGSATTSGFSTGRSFAPASAAPR